MNEAKQFPRLWLYKTWLELFILLLVKRKL